MGKSVSVRRAVGVLGPAVLLAISLAACGGGDDGATPDAAPCQPVDDDNECTEDLCRDGAPVHDPVTPGTPCADGSCSAAGTCLAPTCTDGFENGSETDVDCGGSCAPGQLCDDGDGCARASDCASGVCTGMTCQAPRCGDGLMQPGEMCDDGNDNNGDGCDDGPGDACRPTGCGNGVVTAPEGCDDGNATNGDGCDNNCTPTGCGNGVTTGAETCDDGDLMGGDGCSAACATESGYTCTMAVPSVCTTTCGDGVRAGAELCDDMNTMSGDGCSNGCLVELGFTCMGAPSMCRSTCGDGIVASNEGCDDAPPAENGDGCSMMCTVEPGFLCAGTMPSVCVRRCGNGTVEAGEQCDDGNAMAGDGCVACMLDAGCAPGETARVVTATPALAIPDNDPAGVSSPVMVVGGGGVTRAMVYLTSLTHTYDGDLELALIGPGGVTRTLSARRGVEGDNFRNTLFADSATTAIAAGVAPFTGSFRPDQTLSAGGDLRGTSAQGTWNLRVADLANQDVGTLDAWGLLLCVNTAGPFCGDGMTNGGEECDDGNLNNTDACSNACTLTSGCGDGDLDPGELCDDDNLTAGDGCSAACQPDITCAGGETPVVAFVSGNDPIPDNLPAGLSRSATIDTVGAVTRLIVTAQLTHTDDGDLDLALIGPNGVTRELSTDNGADGNDYAATQFDDASARLVTAGTAPFPGRYRPEQSLSSTVGADFRSTRASGAWTLRMVDDTAMGTGSFVRFTIAACVAPAAPFCGDGMINGTDECDDGNLVDNDACSNLCRIADGCGDGNLDAGETCDDDNVVAGDGCSPACVPDLGCAAGQQVVIVAHPMAEAVPDNSSGLVSSITIPNAGLVRRVIPIVNASHADLGQLDLYLRSPRGVQRALTTDLSGMAYRATLFSDTAPGPIGAGVAPYTGAFQPVQSISDAAGWNGQQAGGVWNLRVGDDTTLQTGTLDSWSLAVCVDPVSATACGNGAVETGEQCDDGGVVAGDGCSAGCQLELGCAGGQTAVVVSAADLPRLVLDNTPAGITSVVDVAQAGNVMKAVVVLGTLTHTYDGDVDVSLVSPTGTSIDLTSGNGQSGEDYVSTILADGAATAITAGVPPYRGRFAPEAMLSGVNGQAATGAWTLKVVDHANADSGQLVSWSLGLCVQ